MPSVLDRLIDPEAEGTAWRDGYGIEQILAAVQRDLEELLNSRQTTTDIPEDCVEVLSSIVAYGLPDLAGVPALTPQQRSEIGRILETIVGRFEPRLRDVQAALLDPEQAVQRLVKFRIEARLNVDPAPEVSFAAILELTTGRSRVRQDGHP
jgi:type VI secretion system protein ImpF